MDFFLGVLILAVGLILSIALHELGHLIPAKLFKVKVSQYFVGFGKTLWSTTRRGTEYGVKMLPLGGYVRMIGMFPPGKSGEDSHAEQSEDARQEERARRTGLRGMAATIVDDTRAASGSDIEEEIHPGDGTKPFYQLTMPRKLAVMFGGPVVNLIISTVLFAIILTGFGTAVPSNQLASITPCVTSSATQPDCSPQDEPSPAAAAGLEPGDRIVSWDGTPVSDWEDLTADIAETGTETVEVVYERDGQQHTTTITPQLVPRPTVEDGQYVLGDDGEPVLTKQPFVGVGASYQLYRQPLSDVPGYVGHVFTATVHMVLTLPQRLVDIAQSTFGGQERDPGVMGVIGVSRVAGQIASIDEGGYGMTERAADLMSLVASLNMALFVFNMIPLLPLDGGHIAGALYEGSRRRLAQLLQRGDPGPVDTAKLMPLTYVVFIVLAGMSLMLAFADIVNPIKLG